MTGRSQLAQWCIKPAGAARTFLRAARRFVQWTRDRARREAVARALDYACWLDSGTTCSGRYRKRSSSFSKQSFASTRAKITGIVLAAPRLQSAERARMINYLAERHGVEISAVFFRYYKLSGGKELPARSVPVADGSRLLGHKHKHLLRANPRHCHQQAQVLSKSVGKCVNTGARRISGRTAALCDVGHQRRRARNGWCPA